MQVLDFFWGVSSLVTFPLYLQEFGAGTCHCAWYLQEPNCPKECELKARKQTGENKAKEKKSKETIKKGSKQRSVGEGRIRAEDTYSEERKIGNRKTQKQKSRKAQKQEKERSN